MTLGIAIIFTACTNENDELNRGKLNDYHTTLPGIGFIGINSDWQEFVLNTYTTDLPDGVDSIQIITNEHPLYVEEVLISPYVVDKDLDEANLAIYYYSNNKTALLAQNNLDNIAYAYMIDTRTNRFMDVLAVTKQESTSFPGKNKVQLFSSVQNTMIASYDGNEYVVVDESNVLMSWGSRFKAALKLLYDDWDDDPVGTLACTVTVFLCAIGAAIASIF